MCWFHTGMCSSRRIKLSLIFNIFRIGVVTGYREGMLNLFNLFSFKHLLLLSQFHIVLFYNLLFHVLSFGPSFSHPAISCPAHWSVNFMSCYFMPCKLSLNFTSSIFSAPSYARLFRLTHWSCTILNNASVVQLYNRLAKLLSTQSANKPCAIRGRWSFQTLYTFKVICFSIIRKLSSFQNNTYSKWPHISRYLRRDDA